MNNNISVEIICSVLDLLTTLVCSAAFTIASTYVVPLRLAGIKYEVEMATSGILPSSSSLLTSSCQQSPCRRFRPQPAFSRAALHHRGLSSLLSPNSSPEGRCSAAARAAGPPAAPSQGEVATEDEEKDVRAGETAAWEHIRRGTTAVLLPVAVADGVASPRG